MNQLKDFFDQPPEPDRQDDYFEIEASRNT
jgi:hypothetical protein